MSYLADLVQMAYRYHGLRESVLHSAIQALQPPLGSRGLDAGCGVGLKALLLAETVGPAGHVTGLDLSPEILVYAREIAEQFDVSGQGRREEIVMSS